MPRACRITLWRLRARALSRKGMSGMPQMAMRAATDEMKAALIQMAMKRVVMRLVSCKEGLPNPG